MIVLAGGDLVLPDRILPSASLLIEGGRIAAVESRTRIEPAGAAVIDVAGRFVVPGLIDVHVHGIDGHDSLDPGEAVARIAARLPRHGVTAFCPTTVACAPDVLRHLLAQVRATRQAPVDGARVLPAHIESNFINPDYRGAQPSSCVRALHGRSPDGAFSGAEILEVIAGHRADVGIVTLAPEIEGGLSLVARLVEAGHRVSLGHSGADFETACAAIDAGARHATHLFNRMSPFTHRAPGLPGAVLTRDEVVPELVCDGFHVHPAACQMAVAMKGPDRIMAITDGTSGAGLPVGAYATLGGRRIRVAEQAAFLDDGTLAGSTLTMDAALRTIVRVFERPLVDAVLMCATTPARALGLKGLGVLVEGGEADVVVLDRELGVERTFVGGRQLFVR